MKKVLVMLAWLASVTVNLLAVEKFARPNIVFLFADDLGIEGINCYGSDRFKDKTPNIVALAKTGIRFERAYSAPLCGPSRCQIMTGRYGFRTGGVNNQAAHIPSFEDEPSLAKTLKQAGYAAGMAGKWRQMGESPGDWGFDARNDGWKLNQGGEVFDMSDSPFIEQPVAADAQNAAAKAARPQLQAVLDQLNPAAGKTAPEPDPAAKKAKRKAKRAAAKE